jgi:hypothetical protein
MKFCSIISHLVTVIRAGGGYEDVTSCSLVQINEKLLSNIKNSLPSQQTR